MQTSTRLALGPGGRCPPDADQHGWTDLNAVVDHLLAYTGGAAPTLPDLLALPPLRWQETFTMLEIVEALAGSLPASPPFEADPVAILLGLMHADTNTAPPEP